MAMMGLNSGPDATMGKGYLLTSRIHCKVNENLCPPEVESRSGSLQNKIEDLVQAINVGVLVDRDGPDERNGFAWQITFLDDVAPPRSYLNLSVYSNSMTTTEDSLRVPMVKTTLMVEGESYGACTGKFVVPSYGGLIILRSDRMYVVPSILLSIILFSATKRFHYSLITHPKIK
jgi:hypothetical protein